VKKPARVRYRRRIDAWAASRAIVTEIDLNHLNLRVRDPAKCRDLSLRHVEFRPAFEADGGYFMRNHDGFLLALVPVAPTSRCLTASTSASVSTTPSV
jgi:hypothetical protein